MPTETLLPAIFQRLPPPQREIVRKLLAEHSEREVFALAQAITTLPTDPEKRKPGRPARDREDLLRDMATLMAKKRGYKAQLAARVACQPYTDGEQVTFGGTTTLLDSMLRQLGRDWKLRGNGLLADARLRIASENSRRAGLKAQDREANEVRDNIERLRLAKEAFKDLRRVHGTGSDARPAAGTFQLHPDELALLKDRMRSR